MFQRFYIWQGINLSSHRKEFGYQLGYTQKEIRQFLIIPIRETRIEKSLRLCDTKNNVC